MVAKAAGALVDRWRRWRVILGFTLLPGLAYVYQQGARHAAQVQEQLGLEILQLTAPPHVLAGDCQASTGVGKAYLACDYSGTIDSSALEKHYDRVFSEHGWTLSGQGFTPNGHAVWRTYSKHEWRAELYRDSAPRLSQFGITLTWSSRILTILSGP